MQSEKMNKNQFHIMQCMESYHQFVFQQVLKFVMECRGGEKKKKRETKIQTHCQHYMHHKSFPSKEKLTRLEEAVADS